MTGMTLNYSHPYFPQRREFAGEGEEGPEGRPREAGAGAGAGAGEAEAEKPKPDGQRRRRRREDIPEEDRIIPKTPADVQRLQLARLTRNIEKPAPIPKPKKEWAPPKPPEFVRNVVGSSAGAGSGEYHIYRNIRRNEYARRRFDDAQFKVRLLSPGPGPCLLPQRGWASRRRRQTQSGTRSSSHTSRQRRSGRQRSEPSGPSTDASRPVSQSDAAAY